MHPPHPTPAGRLVAVRRRPTLPAGGAGPQTSVHDYLLFPDARGDERRALAERVGPVLRRVAAVHHPGLPRVLEAGVGADGALRLSVEQPPGVTLAEVLKHHRRRVTGGRAAGLVRELCAPLAAAHRAGVAHLGLAPERILLRRDGPPVLCELGITEAVLAGCGALSPGARAALAPCLELLAPEQAGGAPGDARSDVHALGLLLARVHGRDWPWGPGDTLAMLARIREGLSDDNIRGAFSGSTADLHDLARRATLPNPESRFQDAAEMEAALGDIWETPVSNELVANLRVEEYEPAVLACAPRAAWRMGTTEAEAEAEEDEEAERARKLRQAEAMLGALLPRSRPPRRRRGMTGLMVGLALVVVLLLLLPRLFERQRPVRRYEGGPDRATGLTHAVPPLRRPAAFRRRPPQAAAERERAPLEGRLRERR